MSNENFLSFFEKKIVQELCGFAVQNGVFNITSDLIDIET